MTALSMAVGTTPVAQLEGVFQSEEVTPVQLYEHGVTLMLMVYSSISPYPYMTGSQAFALGVPAHLQATLIFTEPDTALTGMVTLLVAVAWGPEVNTCSETSKTPLLFQSIQAEKP
jgi:hypothetical protein